MDYLSVTTAEGDRYYLRMVEKKDEEGESFKAWTPQTSAGGRGDQASNVRGSGLCGRSYGAIYNEALVEQSKVRREADASDELTEEGLVTFRFRLIFSILDGKMAFTIFPPLRETEIRNYRMDVNFKSMMDAKIGQ